MVSFHFLEILNVSQIGLAFHGICPPILIQTRLQQYGRGAFFYSAHCSFSNPICFRSVWCRRTMIPGEIFTSSAKFRGFVSVNDFWFPLGFQELLQTSLGFLWSFCYTRIRLDPLSGQVLPHDCIHNFHWELCDLLLSSHQNFLHEVRLHLASSARGPCNFGPLTVWEDRTRQECQGPHYLKCTGNLSTTSWKMKLMARRKDKMIREKMDSIERKVEKSKRIEHTTWAHEHDTWNVMCTPYLSHVCACHQMWINEENVTCEVCCSHLPSVAADCYQL